MAATKLISYHGFPHGSNADFAEVVTIAIPLHVVLVYIGLLFSAIDTALIQILSSLGVVVPCFFNRQHFRYDDVPVLQKGVFRNNAFTVYLVVGNLP